MPLYEITAPDGRTYEIEGPVGATQRQVEAEVLRQFPMAGKTTQELKDAPSAPSKLKDVGLAAKQGLAGGIQSLTNLFGVDNAASQYLGGVQQSAFEGLSPARKEEIARRQELIERSGGDVGSKVGSFLEAPLQTGVQALTGSIPIIAGSFIPGGQIAAGASLGARALAGARGAGGIGGLMGVGGQKGQDYEAVKQALLAQGESPEVAEQKAQEAAQFSLQNLPRQAVAGGAGALEGVFGIESILANAARKVSKGTGAPSLDAPTYKKAIGLSVLGESIPEAAQAAVGQVGTNVALNQAGISKDLTEGLAGTVAHDALVGAVLGLAVSPLQMSNLQREQKQAQAAEQAKKQEAFDKELKDLNDKAAAERAVLQKQTDEIQQRMGQTLALPAPAQILEPEEVTPPLQNPIGNLTPNELGPEVTQYINKYRKDNNLPLLQSYSIEDIKATMTAVNPEGEKAALDSILTAKTGYSGTETYTPENVIDAAVEKNVATDTKGFNDFLTRTTGVNNLEEMSQPQLYAAFKALKDLPANTTGEQIVLPTGSNSSSVPPAKTTLPEGYDIVEKQLKEGEVPESFAITPEGRGKPLTTVINQADVQEKIDRLTGLRQKEAAKTLNDITKYEATVKQGRSQLESMEARGETGTEGYAKAQARQERVEDVLGRRMKDLYDRIESFSAPLQAKPVGKRNLARSGFTIVKDGKETATFPTRQAAEESILTELPDDVLESIVSSTKSGGFAQRAAAEQNRRTSPPKEGKKVSEVLRKIEEEKAKKLEPTPEAKAQMAEVEAKLKPILKQFGLDGVKLNLVDKLDAEGSYNNSLIEIALSEKNPVRVLRHESIHALKDLKFFSPEQWTALTRMAKDQWIDKYLKSRNATYKGQKMSRYDAYVDLYKGDMEKVTEEAIADAFADFDSSKAPPGMLAALLKRLNDFFVALRNALNDAGFQTFEDVFGKIERGELKAGAATQGGKRLSVLPEQVSKIDPNDVGNVVKTSPYKDAGINVLNSQIAKTSKALEVDGVGKLFDEAYLAEFKKRGDWRNPNDFNRAVVQAVDELKFQLRQSKSGLDWYEEDIAEAFKLTQRYIPSLKKPEKRALFSVIAGIMSPSTNARDNWVIATQAYQSYEKTGVLPGTNPATGGLWMGGLESANKKKQLDMLNAMLQPKSRGGLGEKAAVEWLQGSHTVAEITDFRAKYGGMGKSNVGGKATDILPGFTAFGPKVGPFVMNINGIYEVTVDVWMTRTFNRYFGQMMGADGKIIRAPTEPQRVAIKNLAVQAAQQLGIKPYQVQSVLWFLEQQIFNKLGTGAKSYGFSDGAIKFIETQGGVGGAKVSAPDSSVNAVTDGATGKQAGQVSPSAGRLPARTTKQGVSDDTGKQLSLREPTARSGTGGGERLSITGAEEGQSKPSRDRERRDQVRGFTPLAGAPIISGATGPDPSLVKVAEDYARKYKIPYRRQASYVEIDEDFATLVGQAYDAMPHAPNNPKVKEAYQDLNRQTRDQYDALVDAGYTFTFFDSNTDPYDGNPFNAMRDLRKNKQMAVYGTYDGYGTEGITGAAVEDNPMLEDTGLRWPDQNGVEHMVTANDLFRAVHDAFGHGLEGAGFRARGEENAWQAHARLFTGPAVGAITTETRGQNSSLNYGQYGEKNRTAKIEDTVFAEQKTGLMPDWTWQTNIVDDEGVVLGNKQADAVSVKGLHYGKARVEELDASKYGSGVRGAERRRLEQTDDDRIKQRVYFYIAKPDGSTPLPEAGVGQYVYTQKFDNVLGQGPTMSRLFREANGDSNAFESLVVDSGYDGYAVPNMGMMVILNHNTPVNYKGTRSELADDQKRLSLNEAAPNSLLTKRMSSIGIKSTDDFWKRIQNVMIGTGSRNPSLGAALDTTSTSDQVKQAIAVWKKDVDASGIQNYLQKFRIQGAVPEIDDLIAGPPTVKKMLLEAGIRPTLGNAISAYNSLPKSIADDAVNDLRYSLREAPDTPEFKQFFGDSKVVDADGKPLVVYHGAQKNFTQFNTEAKNQLGAHFAASPEIANQFATQNDGDVVYPAYLALNNPYDIESDLGDWSDIEALKEYLGPAGEGPFTQQQVNAFKTPADAVNALKDAGYDGIVYDNLFEGENKGVSNSRSFIAFNPSQIKSATGNVGTFDATSPDIRRSLRAAPDTPEFKRFFAGSKVVDADGKPLVVYHGSNKNEQGKAFTQFDTYGANYGLMGQGSYFTDNPEIASSYAKKGKGDTPTVYPVYLSIQNPIDMDARGNEASWQEAFPDVDFNEYRPEGVKNEDYFRAIEEFITDQQMPKYEGSEIIQDGLRSMGYDGITHRGGARFKTAAGESNTRHQVFIAFDPQQIKSATGNIGTFDATSPDIRFSLREVDNFFNKIDDIKEPEGVEIIRENWIGSVSGLGDRDSAYDLYRVQGGKQYIDDVQDLVRKELGESFKGYRLMSVDELEEIKAGAMGSQLASFTLRPDIAHAFANLASYRKVPKDQLRVVEMDLTPEHVVMIGHPGERELVVDYGQGYNPDAVVEASVNARMSLRDSIDPDTLDRVNETTTTREEKGYIERITDALGGKSYSTFRKEALNRYDYLSKMDKERAKKMGGTAFLADQSAEAAALNSDLAAGVTASVLGVHDRNGGIPVYKNGFTTTFNDDGKIKGPVAIFAPLATYNDPFVYQLYQFWAGAQRGTRLLASGKEELFKPGDFAKAKQLQEQYPEFVEIQKEWNKFNNGLVDFLVDTGVLSKAQKAEFIKYSDYIPFYRQMDGEKTIGPNIFQSISGVKAPKKLKGGEAPLADFLETIVRNTQSSIQMGMKNVAASRAIKNALEIEQAEKLPPNAKVHLDTVQVLEDGNLVSYQAYDMAFVEALKSLNMPDLPFIGLLSGPANLLRNLVTKDPGFMLANMVRDSMAAYVTSGVKMTPILDTFKNFGSALAGTSPEFQALLNAGILGGYEFSQNIEVSGRAFEAELKKKASGKSLLQRIVNPRTAATSLWEALEKGTTASDAATRIEVYKRVLAETNNEAEALYRALEVMNFNRKGSSPVVRILTAAIPFLNARMQGLDVLYRASFGELANKDAKAIQRAFFVRGMTMAALSCMYWALTHDEEEYKKQEQETKDNNWLIPSLGIKIPIPFEIGVIFKVIPERLMAVSFGDDTGKDFMKSMARQLSSTLAVNPIPQAALPFVEAATNYSFFTQRPIVGQGMEGIQPEYQVGPGTSQVSANLGSALGISPMKLDHLIGGFTGTMGMYMVSAIDAILNANSDAPAASKRFEQLPIIRRFAVDPEARGTVTAYYELKNATDSVVRTSNLLERTMNFEERGEFLRDNIKMLASKEYILDLEKTMKDFRQMQVMIRSSNMDADAKREALLRINQAQNALTANIQTLKSNLS